MSAPLRLGLVGLGSMGKNHLRVIAAHPETTLAAIADPDGAAIEAAMAQTGATGFGDALEMIGSARLDGLVIAAPTTAHVALALAAIDHGLSVLVEKPLAANVDDGLAIVTAARRKNVRVQVGHVERYNPAVMEMGRLLREGWLSTIYAVTSRRAGPFPARIRDVGVTVDLGTHDVDMLCWIAGERPLRVYAETAQRIHAGHEDLTFGLMHFPSGATGFLDVDWLTPAKRRSLVALGEEGMFELDYLTQKLTFTRSNVERPLLIGGYATTFTGDVAEIPVQSVEPLRAQLDEFVRVLRTGDRPYVDGEDGLWAVALANALLEAAAQHSPIDLSNLPTRLAAQ
ncbi:MAG TPA: Gfo/Idh/MocA family oxidoreductase [Candidatus Limnocylindrales bacterium]